MTALSITKLTDTFPTPSTPLNPASTAEVHAPQVMPPTLSVVVAMCAGELIEVRFESISLVETFKYDGAIAKPKQRFAQTASNPSPPLNNHQRRQF
ncbi:hypothetical protein HYFRA_00011028 [Hymenoscyphus fraxineus]|uniref:Uncharacterized protein n=1 Tax=Hymenoscyphus fraxineus TaxID=746836 RepID=A0A9N9L4C2_9HELO|nr:hypothetical protein HYFRA_00011028 [Hymenoscyphus fraxineus]